MIPDPILLIPEPFPLSPDPNHILGFEPWAHIPCYDPDISKPDIEAFIEKANLHHPTIKFTAEISDTETVFLDTVVYKGTRFKEKSRGKRNIAFRDTVPALSVYFKSSFNEKWNLIQNQPLLPRQIFKEPPIISHKKGKSLNDMLSRAKI